MRRFLTLVTLAFLILGPFASLLPASAELRLPVCCRRAGMHHCAMSADFARPADGAKHFSAPGHCPRYPARLSVLTPGFLPTQSDCLDWAGAAPFAPMAALDPSTRSLCRGFGRSPPSLI